MKQTPKLVEAKYVGGYRIHVVFEDGVEADLDLEGELWGPVFEPLKDISQFRAFQLDPEVCTIVWASGADLEPEYVYRRAAA